MRAPLALRNMRQTRSASGAGKRSSVQPFWTSSGAGTPVSPAMLWWLVSSRPTRSIAAVSGSPLPVTWFHAVMLASKGAVATGA